MYSTLCDLRMPPGSSAAAYSSALGSQCHWTDRHRSQLRGHIVHCRHHGPGAQEWRVWWRFHGETIRNIINSISLFDYSSIFKLHMNLYHYYHFLSISSNQKKINSSLRHHQPTKQPSANIRSPFIDIKWRSWVVYRAPWRRCNPRRCQRFVGFSPGVKGCLQPWLNVGGVEMVLPRCAWWNYWLATWWWRRREWEYYIRLFRKEVAVNTVTMKDYQHELNGHKP